VQYCHDGVAIARVHSVYVMNVGLEQWQAADDPQMIRSSQLRPYVCLFETND